MNRVLKFLADDETAAFVRARRQQRRIVELLDRLEVSARCACAFHDDADEHDDGQVIEFVYPSCETIIDGGAKIRWFISTGSRRCGRWG